MRRYCQSFGFSRTAIAVAAALCIVLVLALGAFAVSPSLHQRVHSDSNRSDHFCLICAFASGQVGAAETVLVAAIAAVFLNYGVLLRETPLVSSLDYYFSPNRGPPRF